MINQNSITFDYFQEDSFANKSSYRTKFIVKHDSKPSRPQSSKIRQKEPVLLEKKVENLEKKQEL